jgi:hypothetical protein
MDESQITLLYDEWWLLTLSCGDGNDDDRTGKVEEIVGGGRAIYVGGRCKSFEPSLRDLP